MSLESRFVLFSRLEQNLMKPCPQVKLGEPTGIRQLIHQLVNNRDWKLGLAGNGI